ncbi:MAG: ATP-binding cassette domain-containing protein [Thermodesulfobacteriota bacterium]|nr:ATP-binding cassette domain-containing protein [Thermodesulfobacteriota bacterium]
MREGPIVEFNHVTKIYPGGVEGVKDLSFRCHQGETLAIVGTSGSGKTTTLRMINRLVEATSGRILVYGKDIGAYDPVKLRRGMGYVIQHIGLFPHLTVKGNVGLVPELEGWPEHRVRDRVIDLLNRMSMDPDTYMSRYPAELSGGQQQRVGIARALAADPPILLMDEPFGALDPITRGQLQDEFLALKREIKKTVIFVTHDIFEAFKLAGRIAIMHEGRLIQLGTPEEIIEDPADEFVNDLLHGHYFQLALSLVQLTEIMTRDVAVVKEEAVNQMSKECRRLFSDQDVHGLPVVGVDNLYKGFITRASLRNPQNPLARDIPSLKTTETIADALECFKRKPEVQSVPVISPEGFLEGLVNREAVRGYFVKSI